MENNQNRNPQLKQAIGDFHARALRYIQNTYIVSGGMRHIFLVEEIEQENDLGYMVPSGAIEITYLSEKNEYRKMSLPIGAADFLRQLNESEGKM